MSLLKCLRWKNFRFRGHRLGLSKADFVVYSILNIGPCGKLDLANIMVALEVALLLSPWRKNTVYNSRRAELILSLKENSLTSYNRWLVQVHVATCIRWHGSHLPLSSSSPRSRSPIPTLVLHQRSRRRLGLRDPSTTRRRSPTDDGAGATRQRKHEQRSKSITDFRHIVACFRSHDCWIFTRRVRRRDRPAVGDHLGRPEVTRERRSWHVESRGRRSTTTAAARRFSFRWWHGQRDQAIGHRIRGGSRLRATFRIQHVDLGKRSVAIVTAVNAFWRKAFIYSLISLLWTR